ncbi:hypothetical protein BDV93DRAFT_462308, partial [Ceratobasidium sp. AG-I]
QSVKEVLQFLVDDGVVHMDKIESSNFFWSFPSARGAYAPLASSTNEGEDVESFEVKIAALRQDIESESAKRVDTPQRRTSLTLLQAKRGTLADLKGQLAQHGLAGPVVLERKRRAVVLGHEASVTWRSAFLTPVAPHIEC